MDAVVMATQNGATVIIGKEFYRLVTLQEHNDKHMV